MADETIRPGSDDPMAKGDQKISDHTKAESSPEISKKMKIIVEEAFQAIPKL